MRITSNFSLLWLSVALIAGICLYWLLLGTGLQQPVAACLGITLLTAVLWISNAIPIPTAALIPFILFPATGLLTFREASSSLGAHIILLLVTPRFLASEHIYDQQLTQAMERHDAGTARVIPIILKPVDFKGTQFEKLQALPKDAKPVTRWDDQDEAFLNVVQGIRRVVESLSANP